MTPARVPGGRMTWHALVLLVSAAVALFSRFFRPSVYGYFEDDFFYYALVARHLVLNHISSADGIHLTNGYHPLWMLVLAACFKLAPGLDFLIAIQAVAFAAVLLYYAGLLRCLTFLGVPPNLRRLSALVLSLHALLLFRYGMEVTLALPLSIWMLAFVLAPGFRWTSRQAFAYGLLASLTVLSRLDSIFLIALLIAAQTVSAAVPWPQRLHRLAIFSLGWFPFFIYLASNVYFFHALLPVSGSAKQLKPLWPPSSIPLQSLFLPFDRTKAAFVYPAILLILVAATIFLRKSAIRRAQPQRSAILAALFLFPVIHLSVLSLLSDWTIWPWYYYSLCYAVLAATAVLLTPQSGSPPVKPSRLPVIALASAVVVLTAYLATYALFKQPARPMLVRLGDFVRGHPGTYAMGDGSGTPAYLGGQPFIQLEGLTMDAAYIRLLRARTPLPDVLAHYHADYYATFRSPTAKAPCLPLAEPAQAGPHSPQLAGQVCSPPLAVLSDGDLEVDIFKASDVLPR